MRTIDRPNVMRILEQLRRGELDPPGLDRRAARTRRNLRIALFELIAERNYDELTIQDILDRADTGRSTFYAHFRNKDELLIGDMPQRVALSAPEAGRVLPRVTPFLEHLAENYDLFRALAGTSGMPLALDRVRRALLADWEARLADHGLEPLRARAQAVFLAGGFLELVRFWLDASMPISAQELGDLFDQLASSESS